MCALFNFRKVFYLKLNQFDGRKTALYISHIAYKRQYNCCNKAEIFNQSHKCMSIYPLIFNRSHCLMTNQKQEMINLHDLYERVKGLLWNLYLWIHVSKVGSRSKMGRNINNYIILIFLILMIRYCSVEARVVCNCEQVKGTKMKNSIL